MPLTALVSCASMAAQLGAVGHIQGDVPAGDAVDVAMDYGKPENRSLETSEPAVA